MTPGPITHPTESTSNTERATAFNFEPKSLRTYTPSQARHRADRRASFTGPPKAAGSTTSPPACSSPTSATTRSSGCRRFTRLHGLAGPEGCTATPLPQSPGYFAALPMTAYNAITPVETRREQAARRRSCNGRPGGERLEQVMWAASGSEAIQKALWAALARDRTAADDPRHAVRLPRQEGARRRRHRLARPTASATRACASSRFPMNECRDVAMPRRAVRPGAVSEGTRRPVHAVRPQDRRR